MAKEVVKACASGIGSRHVDQEENFDYDQKIGLGILGKY